MRHMVHPSSWMERAWSRAGRGRLKEVRTPVTDVGVQHMDIPRITENLYIASRVRGDHLEDILRLDPGLIISMIV